MRRADCPHARDFAKQKSHHVEHVNRRFIQKAAGRFWITGPFWIQQLAALPNVRFLGSKTVQELAAYPQHFDVCIMPYKRDDYTKYIYPLKLHEYLAAGRPIVGTPIASLESFRDLILLPTNAEQWADALSQALDGSANSAEQRRRRQDLAKQHDWEVLVRKIASLIAERLGVGFAQEFRRRCAVLDGVSG